MSFETCSDSKQPTCLFYSSLHMLPLDISVLQQAVYLDVSVLQLSVPPPGRVCSTAACAAPERVCSTAECAAPERVCSTADRATLSVSVLQQTVLPWACLFYRGLCCPCTYLFYSRLCYPGRICSMAACAAHGRTYLHVLQQSALFLNQIIRPRESPALYKSLNSLWFESRVQHPGELFADEPCSGEYKLSHKNVRVML